MAVQCYELLKIPSFKNIKLVAGETGLHRQVTWVYVLQTPSLKEWVYGGEFMFVVNHNNVSQIIQEAVSHRLSGVVVLKNEQNESNLNEEIINYANKEQLPLFEMDYHIKLLDITKDISTFIVHKQQKTDYLNHFFYKILLSDDLIKKEIDEFALHVGYNSGQACFISTLYSEDVSKLDQTSIFLQMYMDDEDIETLSIVINPYIVILTFVDSTLLTKAKRLLKSTFGILNEKQPNLFYMGIGNTYFSLYDIRNSYLKSIKTLPLCTKEKRIIDFDELGFSRLLLDTLDYKELREYANHFLGEIKEYDKKNGTFFLETIEAYILSNGNINKTSTKLYIHRNTCVYRLAKIRELFQIDIDDPYIRADILNSLSIFRYLDSPKIPLNSKNMPKKHDK
ncbi:MAG: hypothetical protein GX923_01060 [Clostridia bacterium]|nr:hypothetical protein [Clostridia bacterium]